MGVLMAGLRMGVLALLVTPAIGRAQMPLGKAAAAFGARPSVEQISLSPDGTHIAFVAPIAGKGNIVEVAPLEGNATPIARADGAPFKLVDCGWSAGDRLVCRQYGIVDGLQFTRSVAIDSAGTNMKSMARSARADQIRLSQFDGRIIDWMSGKDGSVLMMRDFVPEMTTGSRLHNSGDGRGVERVDTRTLQATVIEQPRANARHYISDGRGEIRLMVLDDTDNNGLLTGKTIYMYRAAGGKGGWKPLLRNDGTGDDWTPIAVDPGLDAAYALHKTNGRDALYRISLDGNATKTLVYAHPQVDVADVIQVGRAARVVGATYVTDRRNRLL